MPTYQYANNASSLLAAAISDTDTTIQVTPSDGDKFPSPNASLGLQFSVTLQDETGANEICLCTARTADTLTVVRAQEGTSAVAWDPGTGPVRVELRLTQAALESLLERFVPYVSGGDGLRFNDVAGVTDAWLLGREDPARAGKLLGELYGSGAALLVKSLIELKLNDVAWPLATASRTEGYVPELDSTTDTLTWMPRGARVLDEGGSPVQRRADIQYTGGVAVTDDGTKTVVTVAGAIIGEVRSFAGALPSAEWLLCDGSVLNVGDHPALGAYLGSTFGGDGVTTFGLPDARGRATIGVGQGTGLTDRVLGATVGAETHLLDITEVPAHTHVGTTAQSKNHPTGPDSNVGWHGSTVAGGTTGSAGGGLAHNNMQPSIAFNVAIYAGS